MADPPKHTPQSIESGLRAAAEAEDLDVLVPWLETALEENRAGRLDARDLKRLNDIASDAITRIRQKLDARKARAKAARRLERRS